jgi:hypothetical protein
MDGDRGNELEVWSVEDLEVPIYLQFFRRVTSRKPLAAFRGSPA